MDEAADEQGIAHMIEHIVLLGSKQEPTGVVCNAYTGFHHTVYHAHAPFTKSVTRQLLPKVIVHEACLCMSIGLLLFVPGCVQGPTRMRLWNNQKDCCGFLVL